MLLCQSSHFKTFVIFLIISDALADFFVIILSYIPTLFCLVLYMCFGYLCCCCIMLNWIKLLLLL